MTSVDLLVKNASELVTMQGAAHARVGKEMCELGIIEGGDIAVKDGHIVEIGRNLEYDAEKTIDASGKTVIPGFVDPHTHLVFGGSREFELDWKLQGLSYMQIKERGGGIGYTVDKTREATADTLYREARSRLNRMLFCGTTTCEAKSGYGLETECEVKMLEVARDLGADHPMDVVSTFLGAHDIPKDMRGEDYVNLLLDEMLPKVKDLAVFCDVFCEKGVFTPEQTRCILEAGKSVGLRPKIHADEIVDTGGAGLAASVGAISADHLLRASDKGIKAMAEAGVIGVMLPGTPFALRMNEYAPARRIIDLGVPLALATDLNPNCWTENMQFMIQLGCFNMGLTPAESLCAATFNSACAIGMQESVGSLESEKKADILILDCPNHLFIPYHFGVNLVDMVIKEGTVVVTQ